MAIEFSALTKEAANAQKAAKQLRGKAWMILRKVSLDTTREVKREMPVLSGRARASWGIWSDSVRVIKRVNGKRRTHSQIAASYGQLFNASDADSIWDEDEGALRITQGSALEYIEALNSGHSRQAPSGFLDLIAEKASLTLGAALAQVAEAL